MSSRTKPRSLKELSDRLSRKHTHYVYEIKNCLNFGSNRTAAEQFRTRNKNKWLITVKKLA